MKIRNLIIVFILQLVVILVLFGYFYTQKRDLNTIVYLSVNNIVDQKGLISFYISEIDEYIFQQDNFQTKETMQYDENVPKLNISVGDTVYLKLDQYAGQTSIAQFATKSYSEMIEKPFIKGKVVEIEAGRGEGYDFMPNRYKINYGIEQVDFNVVPSSLLDAVAKVEIDAQGQAKILEIYNDHKVIYQVK